MGVDATRWQRRRYDCGHAQLPEAAARASSADAARCYAIARGSAMEYAPILDALCALQVVEPARHQRGIELLERIVAMWTKLCR
jgi:four helix bundle protein